MRFLFSLLLLAACTNAAEIVPATYRPAQGNWVDYCGVEGGIPFYDTRHGDVIAAYTGTPATIETALDGAASGTYVELGAGTFNINNNIELNDSGVELRGQTNANGFPTTIINFTGGGDRSFHIRATSWDISSGGAGAFTSRAITTPAAADLRGVTTVTLASAPTGLVVDQIMFVSSAQAFIGSVDSSDFLGNEHSQQVRVTGISGSDVTFEPAINADYLTGTITVYYRTLSAHIKRSGVRNIKMTGGQGNYIGFSGADECWAVNCVTEETVGSAHHFLPYASYRCEIRHCDSSGNSTDSNSAYVLHPIQCSQFLVVDNYFHNMPNLATLIGWNGSAIVYNFCTDFPYVDPDWLSQGIFFHGAHSHYNLVEGNWYPSNHNDDFNNSSARNNLVARNRIRGWDATPGPTGKTDNTKPFALESSYPNFAIVGNILGEDGYHDTYETSANEFANDVIYYVEAGTSGLIREGNWNTVDNTVPASEDLGSDTVASSYIYTERQPFMHYFPLMVTNNFTSFNTVHDSTNLLASAFRAANSGLDPDWSEAQGEPGRPILAGKVNISGKMNFP